VVHRWGIALVALAVLAASCATAPSHVVIEIAADLVRENVGLVDAPPSPSPGCAPGESPAPLLVSLHPFVMEPAVWEDYGGLGAAAEARGFEVLTPRGSDPGPRWSVPGGLPGGPDDIGRVNGLIDELMRGSCIDRNRVFAAGFSAGAAMAVALGCAAPQRFTAVVASGGANLTDLCPESPGVDALILHGTADPVAPPTGSYVVFAPPLGLHIDSVVADHAARAGCTGELPVDSVAAGVERTAHSGCDTGVRVERWYMVGAGHTWAGATGDFEAVLGPTATSIAANDVALDFFESSHRSAA